MATGQFQYAMDQSMCMAVTNVQQGSQLSLQSTTYDPNKTLWNYNTANKYIYIASAGPVPGLCVTITGFTCSGNPILTLQTPLATSNANAKYQQWSLFPGSSTFLTSVGCPGNVIDSQNRQTSPGTPIWLYAFNGSQAQQWVFQTFGAFEREALQLEEA